MKKNTNSRSKKPKKVSNIELYHQKRRLEAKNNPKPIPKKIEEIATQELLDSLPYKPEHQIPYLELARWMTTPPSQRAWKSQKEFCEHFGVMPEVVREWKRSPEFWKSVKAEQKYQMEQLLPSWTIGMDKALRRGDVNALRFFKQYFEDWVPNVNVNHSLIEQISTEIEELDDGTLDIRMKEKRVIDAEIVEEVTE